MIQELTIDLQTVRIMHIIPMFSFLVSYTHRIDHACTPRIIYTGMITRAVPACLTRLWKEWIGAQGS
jgi:hypothetical protein